MLVGEELLQALHHQQQALVRVLGLENHLALPLDFALVGAHQAVAGSGRFDLARVGGAGAMFLPLLNQALGLDDLAPVELAILIGLLEHSAEVLVVVLGAGDFQGSSQRNGAALHAFDQTLLPLVQQEDDVFDVLG